MQILNKGNHTCPRRSNPFKICMHSSSSNGFSMRSKTTFQALCDVASLYLSDLFSSRSLAPFSYISSASLLSAPSTQPDKLLPQSFRLLVLSAWILLPLYIHTAHSHASCICNQPISCNNHFHSLSFCSISP